MAKDTEIRIEIDLSKLEGRSVNEWLGELKEALERRIRGRMAEEAERLRGGRVIEGTVLGRAVERHPSRPRPQRKRQRTP